MGKRAAASGSAKAKEEAVSADEVPGSRRRTSKGAACDLSQPASSKPAKAADVKTEQSLKQSVKTEMLSDDEKAERKEMIAKLHYLKKKGNSKAYDEYSSKDRDGKRAWFFEVYKADPSLAKFNNALKSRTLSRCDIYYLCVAHHGGFYLCFHVFMLCLLTLC